MELALDLALDLALALGMGLALALLMALDPVLALFCLLLLGVEPVDSGDDGTRTTTLESADLDGDVTRSNGGDDPTRTNGGIGPS